MIVDNVDKLPKIKGGFTFVSGCFDLLHPGHLRLLNYAASFGKKVVIGLNITKTIKKLKGKDTIFPFAMRAKMLDNLYPVSFIIPLKTEDARELVRKIKPKNWILGSDHAGEDFSEFKDIRICFLKRDNNSSTNKLEHIRKYLLCGNG